MRPVILLTATKRVDISQAAVLADVLREPRGKGLERPLAGTTDYRRLSISALEGVL